MGATLNFVSTLLCQYNACASMLARFLCKSTLANKMKILLSILKILLPILKILLPLADSIFSIGNNMATVFSFCLLKLIYTRTLLSL